MANFQDDLLIEMANALDTDVDDLYSEDETGLSSFGFDVMKVGGIGEDDWIVVEDEDTARDLAIAVVTQDLEEEPEIFNQSFLESHINQDRLKEWVYEAVMEDDYAYDIGENDPERFWEEYESWDLGEAPEEDEDGEFPLPNQSQAKQLQRAIADERSDDPMGWLLDMYGDDEAIKKAMELAGFDVAAAAEEAVDIDGWAHFLSRYDGNYATTDAGFVYWRDA